MISKKNLTIAFCTLAISLSAYAEKVIKPGKAFDYPSMAFYPKRWKEAKLDIPMYPWEGKNITFVTSSADHDPKVMTAFISNLDAGWDLYADITGTLPRVFKNYNGKGTVVGIPANNLSCGYGCGYVGATGIEMIQFPNHFKNIQKNHKHVPHAYYYEMGRNFYTFGDKHSCFVTGFAVFMRYVCLDSLGLDGGDHGTRKTIYSAIDIYEKSQLEFVSTFTTFGGLGEKGNRLKDKNGKTIRPSDQNVLYASLLLRLRRDYGGNAWVKEFYHQIHKLPKGKANDQATALRQCVSMLVCASLAADKDLTSLFVDKYRLPLDKEVRSTLSKIDWSNKELTSQQVLQKLPKALRMGAK